MKDPGAPKIHELIHYIALCTQKDVVLNGATMELRRSEVVWAWARVRSHYGLPSFLGRDGYTVIDPVTKATHAITVRAGLGLIITSAAYIYEQFRKSPPRWYRVLGWSETDDFITMPVRLIELSDFALPPLGSLAPQPTPVEL